MSEIWHETSSYCLLRVHALRKSYQRRQVVSNVSVDVYAGEIVGLLGPNGAGKTTTFNMIAGLIQPDVGHIYLGEDDLQGEPLYRRVQAGLGYLPQEGTVFRGLTVIENILVVLENQKLTTQQRKTKAEEIITKYRLQHVRESYGSQLSGGERRRLEIARTLAGSPRILLLDEPFAGIDPIAVAEMKNFIRLMREHGMGIFITDHNVHETLRICDRAYLIYEGRVMLSGTPKEIVESESAREMYLGRDFQL